VEKLGMAFQHPCCFNHIFVSGIKTNPVRTGFVYMF